MIHFNLKIFAEEEIDRISGIALDIFDKDEGNNSFQSKGVLVFTFMLCTIMRYMHVYSCFAFDAHCLNKNANLLRTQ